MTLILAGKLLRHGNSLGKDRLETAPIVTLQGLIIPTAILNGKTTLLIFITH